MVQGSSLSQPFKEHRPVLGALRASTACHPSPTLPPAFLQSALCSHFLSLLNNRPCWQLAAWPCLGGGGGPEGVGLRQPACCREGSQDQGQCHHVLPHPAMRVTSHPRCLEGWHLGAFKSFCKSSRPAVQGQPSHCDDKQGGDS